MMTSLWLLSRIRFGVVEMGFEPKNVAEITSYHILVHKVYRWVESTVVVGCFSFVMLCEKGTNDSLVHFASPPFTLYIHFGGPRSNTFLGRNLSLSLELSSIPMYLVLYRGLHTRVEPTIFGRTNH